MKLKKVIVPVDGSTLAETAAYRAALGVDGYGPLAERRPPCE